MGESSERSKNSSPFEEHVLAALKGFKLSPMETKVAWLTLKGIPYETIGKMLGVSHKTVKTHILHIFSKSGAATRAEFSAFIFPLRGQPW